MMPSPAPLHRSRAGAHNQRTPIWRGGVGYLFLLPAALLCVALLLLPVLQAAYYSLFDWDGLGPLGTFVGAENYARALSDRGLLRALTHNAQILLLSLALQLPLALALAVAVDRLPRGRALMRTLLFLPYVLSEVITGLIWGFIYNPQSGPVSALLRLVAPDATALAPLASPDTVLFALFVAISWKFFGYHLTLYTAGLQQIPLELEEAARIDGCGALDALRYVTLPLLAPTIRLSVYLSVLGSLQLFELVWVMTAGGPAGASSTAATHLYTSSFQRFQLGYGSAIAVLLFSICFGLSLLYQRALLRRETVL